jgi:protocatechuate 3,4-dioxygenase alpha subunit
MTRDRKGPAPTPSQTVGPFFHFALAKDDRLGRMPGEAAAGERLRLRVRVEDGDGQPVPDALVEIMHAGSGFGRLATGHDGTCVFDAVRPGTEPDGRSGLQAPHFNVCLFARGLNHHLYTRIYFDGDPALAGDAILAAVPEDRRRTLVAERDPSGTWTFVIHLQGDAETVFFDL